MYLHALRCSTPVVVVPRQSGDVVVEVSSAPKLIWAGLHGQGRRVRGTLGCKRNKMETR